MATKHWRLVLNGKVAGDAPLREAVALMRADGVVVDVRVTWECGDVERFITDAIKDGVDSVIAAGGDGTFSEVAGALAARVDDGDALPTIGLIPLGTANVYAGAAPLPIDPLVAMRLIHARPASGIDVLRVTADGEARWCVNMVSGGFGAEVSADTNAQLKQHLGGAAYLLTGIAELGKIQPVQARVIAEDMDWQGEFIALACGNGRQAGGGHVVCPEAFIDDGLLDITIVPPPDGDMLATLGTLLSAGTDAALEKAAIRRQLRGVEIHALQPFGYTLDGEAAKAASLRVECLPGRLRMHLPRDCPLLKSGMG
jgi:lipid kinase YegS